jgi:hypothetical protein
MRQCHRLLQSKVKPRCARPPNVSSKGRVLPPWHAAQHM